MTEKHDIQWAAQQALTCSEQEALSLITEIHKIVGEDPNCLGFEWSCEHPITQLVQKKDYVLKVEELLKEFQSVEPLIEPTTKDPILLSEEELQFNNLPSKPLEDLSYEVPEEEFLSESLEPYEWKPPKLKPEDLSKLYEQVQRIAKGEKLPNSNWYLKEMSRKDMNINIIRRLANTVGLAEERITGDNYQLLDIYTQRDLRYITLLPAPCGSPQYGDGKLYSKKRISEILTPKSRSRKTRT